MTRNLELAADLGAPIVRTFAIGRPIEGLTDAQAIDWVVDGLGQAVPTAERLGVKIALETHDFFSLSARVTQALVQLPSPYVGVLWDILHPFRFGESPEQTWSQIGARLIHVHIKDGKPDPNADRPEDWALTLLGEGAVPVPAILEVLVEHGYRGYLSVEWEKAWHPEIPEPEVALPQHPRVLREWLGAL